jgi:hypothetical protein
VPEIMHGGEPVFFLHKQGFFIGWGISPALNFGEKLHTIFAKGGEKNLMQIQFLGKNA